MRGTSGSLGSSFDSAAWSPMRTSLPASGKAQKPRGDTRMGGLVRPGGAPVSSCSRSPGQELGRKLTQGEEGSPSPQQTPRGAGANRACLPLSPTHLFLPTSSQIRSEGWRPAPATHSRWPRSGRSCFREASQRPERVLILGVRSEGIFADHSNPLKLGGLKG